jgi:multidrug efflux pump
MTSFAFILGVIPLVMAHGAGAEMRRVLGTAVFSGMLGVTMFGVFLTPVFFVAIDRVSRLKIFHVAALQNASQLALGTMHLRWLKPAWNFSTHLRPRRRSRQTAPPPAPLPVAVTAPDDSHPAHNFPEPVQNVSS